MIPQSVVISPVWIKDAANNPEFELFSSEAVNLMENRVIVIEATNAIDVFEAYNEIIGLVVNIHIGMTKRRIKPKEIVYVGEDSALFCIAFKAEMEWTK